MEDCIVLVTEKGVEIIKTDTLEGAEFNEGLLEKILVKLMEVSGCDRIESINLKPSEYSLASGYLSAAKLWHGVYKYGVRIVVKNIFGGTLFDKKILGATVITMNVENEAGSIDLVPFPSEVDAQFFIDNYLEAYLLTE